MDNQISNSQTTMERIKCSIKQPKVQTHMTLQSLGKHIKQENQGKDKQSRIKKHWRGTYTQWFALHLWPHIQIVAKKHKSLTTILHYLRAFHRKQENIEAHLISSLNPF
jgi:Ni,Fe-hydrogenase I large subunit